MKSTLLILFLTLCFSNLYSQNSFNDGVIKGYVYDNNSKTPLEGVSVQLIKPDSSISGGAGTDATGYFIIENIAQGRYRLILSLAGYNRKGTNINLADASQKIIDLDTIYMNSGTETEEIVVEGEKSFIEFDAEKKIFNVENNMNVTGGTVIDVLKNLPSISVDIDNNVSLRGGQKIKFMINGRPVHGNVTRILEQMSADQLSSVEVITNPSAKFEAEGSTGVINLVLKKFDDSGVNGQIGLNGGTGDKYGSNFNMNYRKTNQYNLSGSYDYRIRNMPFSGTSSRTSFFNPDEYLSNQNSDGRMRREGHNARAEFEYFLSPNDILSLGGNYGKSNRKNGDTDNLFIYNTSNALTENSITKSEGTDDGEDYGANITFNKLFKNPKQTFITDLSYSFDKDNDLETKTTQYIFPTGQQNEITQNNSTDKNNQVVLQSDYVHPFSKETRFETGIRYNWRDREGQNFYYNFDNTTSQYVLDPALSDNFKFTENIGAVYGIYTSRLDNFAYSVGLRGEYSTFKVQQFNFNSEASRNRFDVFPSISLSQTLGMTEEINLSYSRRVRRPGYRELSPVTRIQSPISQSRGNPDLTPEFVNSFELNFSKFFNTVAVIPSVFYKWTTDKITRVTELIDSNVILSYPINASEEKSYGGELILNASIAKIINLNGSVSYYKQEIESDTLGTNSGFTFGGRMFANVTLPWDAGLQVTYFYTGDRITPQGQMDGFNIFDVALRKDFLDKKLSFNFRVSDLFNAGNFNSTINTGLYSQTFSRLRDSRVFTLSVTYKFGTEDKNRTRTKKPRREQQEQEPDIEEF